MSLIRVALVSLALAAGASSFGRVEAQGTTEAVNDVVPAAPVELDGALLFNVRGVSSYPAETRARAIHQRIVEVANNPAVAVDSIRTLPTQGAIQILAGDLLIMAVFDADASLEGLAAADVATAHLV